MNIGIVTTWFESGSGYVSRQYMDILSMHHDVFIYARGGEYAQDDMFKAKTSPFWNLQNVTYAKKTNEYVTTSVDLKDFKSWLVKNNIHLVVFNEQTYWLPVVMCNEMGIITGAYIDYYTEQTVPFFSIYDFVFCNTKRHWSVFQSHHQSFYIPWGTNVDVFKPQSFNVVENNYVTFFHSAYYSPDRKGTDAVIEAFSRLPLNTKLIIHSKNNVAEIFPHIRQSIDHLIKKQRLKIISDTITAPGLYHLGDVYVYPSKLEGIGLTIAEAIACGLPAIVGNNPPMNEFVIHNKNGRLVEIEKLVSRADSYYWPQCFVKIDDLEKQMQYYVKKSDTLPLLKRKARRYAENKLNWFKNARDLNEIIGRIKKTPYEQKKSIIKVILDYENDRTSLKHKYPALYDIIRFILQLKHKL